MAHLLTGANHTAQWFQPFYPRAENFDHLDKFVLHTTETTGWPGYADGAIAPNATYHPLSTGTKIRQHFYSDRSSRALVDPTDTAVRENRDNVFQLEIIAYSDYALAQSVGGLWIGDLTDQQYQEIANIIFQLHVDLGLPIQQSVEWHEGRKTSFDDVRLTGPQFDAYKGILGHCHVSGNTHWDPGGFYISKLMSTLEGNVALTDEDVDKVAKRVWAEMITRLTDDTPVMARSLLQATHKNATDAENAAKTNTAKLDEVLQSLMLGGVNYDLIAAKVVDVLVSRTELGWRVIAEVPPPTA